MLGRVLNPKPQTLNNLCRPALMGRVDAQAASRRAAAAVAREVERIRRQWRRSAAAVVPHQTIPHRCFGQMHRPGLVRCAWATAPRRAKALQLLARCSPLAEAGAIRPTAATLGATLLYLISARFVVNYPTPDSLATAFSRLGLLALSSRITFRAAVTTASPTKKTRARNKITRAREPLAGHITFGEAVRRFQIYLPLSFCV